MRLGRWIGKLAGTVLLTLAACDEPDTGDGGGAAQHRDGASSASEDVVARPNGRSGSAHFLVRDKDLPAFADLGDARAVSLGDAPIKADKDPVALDIARTGVRITMPPAWSITREGGWWFFRSPSGKTRFVLSELSGQTTRPKGELPRLVGEKKPIWRPAAGDTPGGKWQTYFTAIQRPRGPIITVIAAQTDASEEEKLDAQRILGSIRLVR